METSEEQTPRRNATADAMREERVVAVELEMFNQGYIEKCSDESTLRAIYEHLLRNEHGNFTDIKISVKEKLIALHRQKEQVKQMLAAVTKDFNALAADAEDLHALVQAVVVEVGFDQNRQKWVEDLFNPNDPYDLNNESFKIEREKWELNVRLYLLMQTKEWGTIDKAAQEEAIWRMRKEMQVLRKKRDEHDRNLSDGNIDIEKEDGTSSSSWIPNQGEIMNPAESNAVLVAHYATENEKYFVEEAVFIGDRLVQDLYHRMDRSGNVSLYTIDFNSVRHSLYYTLEEEGSPVPWNDIDIDMVDPYCKRIAIMDKDAIILNRPIKGLTDNGGNKVSDERQLREQRIRYAEASKFDGVGTLNKKDLSEFNSLANLAFNVLAIVATTGQPAVVAAVGAQSKKIFRKSGGDAFMTSQINYVGWVYHPESMNRVCVTNLAYLRRSDAVMAQFLSLGVILRRAVYRYAENRCNDKYTDEEREAVNELIGKVGKDYKVIAEAIEKYRESDSDNESDNELMTNLEIFVEIVSSLKGKVEAGAITGYKKLLELSDEANSIDEMVNEYHMREGSLTKRECFNAIKDTLLSSFTDEAKNVYLNRLHREDIKTIYAELARAKKDAKAAGGEVDLDKFFEEVRRKYRDISNGAIEFVRAGEKSNNDVKTISEELARAKKDAKAAGGEVDLDKFFEEVRRKYRDISNGAIEFVRAGEKKSNDVKTIYAELARAKKDAKAAGGEVDLDKFFEEERRKYRGISTGAIALVAGSEKHHNDVKAISEEVARAKKEVAQFRRNNPNAKSSLDSSSAVVTLSAAFEKISDGRQLYDPALLQISVPPIPEYVPPLPLCVGSQATVDRNDVVPLPQPGHRVSIKRSWYTHYLGWLDEHGGTIKSTSEGEDGGMILHIACDLLQMGELEVPYPHDQVTVNFNQPKFSTKHYWDDSRLLSSYSNED